MKKLSGIFLIMLLTVNLAGCGYGTRNQTKLFAGFCSYYADGGLSSFEEHSYEYDAKGNLVKECVYYNGYLNSYSEFDYDSGDAVETVYDNNDRIKAVRELYDDGSLKSEKTYNYKGEPEGYAEYDESGLEILKEVYGSYNYRVEYEYDENGNVVKETETDLDENGNLKDVYETIYDTDGNLIRRMITYPDGSSTVSSYTETEEDGNDRIRLQYDGEGTLRYRFEENLNDEGHLLKTECYLAEDDSLLSSKEYEYDDEGRVITFIYFFRDETVTGYEYSDEGYLCKESVSYPRMVSNEPYGDGSDSYEVLYTRVTYYDADGDITRTENLYDGTIIGYSEYYYEHVNAGRNTSYDYRDEKRELDPRAQVVY